GGQIGTGGNMSVQIGGNLTTNGTGGDAGKFDLTIQNTNGQITNGGNITLVTGGSVFTGGEFNVLVENYDETANPAGHIGTGGNISLTVNGNLTADFASIALNNRGGGMIDSDVNLTIDIGGALTTLHQGTDFHGDATLQVNANNLNTSAGSLDVFLFNKNGGVIDGSATVNFDLTGNLTVAHYATFLFQNHQNSSSNGLPGGSIGSAATLSISAA